MHSKDFYNIKRLPKAIHKILNNHKISKSKDKNTKISLKIYEINKTSKNLSNFQ